MTVVTNPPTNYMHREPAGGHAMLVDIDTMLKAAGLTPVAITGGYDVEGADSQLVNVPGTVSPWLVYAFSDPAQTDYPITISIALRYQRAGNGNNSTGYAFLPCFRISEGVTSDGTPIGRTIENIPVDASSYLTSGSTDLVFRLRASLGDFCRYTGDSLTFFFGTNGMYLPDSSANGAISSAYEIHIERRRSAVDGTIQSGFNGLVQPIRAGPSGGFAPFFPSGADCYRNTHVQNTPLAFVRLESPPYYLGVGNLNRASGDVVLSDAGTPVVAPIFVQDANGRLTSLRRMFSIPMVPGKTDGTILTFDFVGEERPYLYRTFPGTYYGATSGVHARYAIPPLAALFEWET